MAASMSFCCIAAVRSACGPRTSFGGGKAFGSAEVLAAGIAALYAPSGRERNGTALSRCCWRRRRPLIELDRIAVRVLDDIGAVDDLRRREAGGRDPLGHLAAAGHDHDDAPEGRGARLAFALADHHQGVLADG